MSHEHSSRTILTAPNIPVFVQNWADMEREYRAVQAECEDLQSLLVDRDHQLCSLNQDLLDLTHRMKVLLYRCMHTASHLRSRCRIFVSAFSISKLLTQTDATARDNKSRVVC